MAVPRLTPVTEIKRRATEVIADVRATRQAVLITERGRSAAVLLDVETYDALLRRLAVLEGIARGERAYSGGRVVSRAEARRRLRRWLGARA